MCVKFRCHICLYYLHYMYGSLAITGTKLTIVSADPKFNPGNILRELRDKRGLSMRQAAKLAGISHTRVSEIEDSPGRLEGLKLSTLEGLAHAYGISVTDMIRIARGKSSDHTDKPDHAQLTPLGSVVRSTRTIPTFRLIVSASGKGELVKDERTTYFDDDREGEFEAYVLEGAGPNTTTIITRKQSYARKGNQIVCEVPEYGVIVAQVAGIEQGTYFLLPETSSEPIVTKEIKILGVVVRKQKDFDDAQAYLD